MKRSRSEQKVKKRVSPTPSKAWSNPSVVLPIHHQLTALSWFWNIYVVDLRP